jgi:hypothetical protein
MVVADKAEDAAIATIALVTCGRPARPSICMTSIGPSSTHLPASGE